MVSELDWIVFLHYACCLAVYISFSNWIPKWPSNNYPISYIHSLILSNLNFTSYARIYSTFSTHTLQGPFLKLLGSLIQITLPSLLTSGVAWNFFGNSIIVDSTKNEEVQKNSWAQSQHLLSNGEQNWWNLCIKKRFDKMHKTCDYIYIYIKW